MVNQIKFQTLNNKCIKCRKCSLSSTRKNVVFGRGNPNSKLFVVGEGPGQQEDEQGVAFVSECIPWLEKQIGLIKPKVIVLAGSTAVESYLQVTEPISKIRGKWIIKDDIKYMPIFHPSYLLRNPSKEKGKPKWLTWQDLKKVKEELNLT